MTNLGAFWKPICPLLLKKIILFSLKNKLFLLFIQYEQCYYIHNQLGDRVQFLFKELLL